MFFSRVVVVNLYACCCGLPFLDIFDISSAGQSPPEAEPLARVGFKRCRSHTTPHLTSSINTQRREHNEFESLSWTVQFSCLLAGLCFYDIPRGPRVTVVCSSNVEWNRSVCCELKHSTRHAPTHLPRSLIKFLGIAVQRHKRRVHRVPVVIPRK